MTDRRRLVRNTALLTGVSLLMSCIGMLFQVWLVGRLGSAGIGLYQLTLSVMGLFATLAISGIRFAATRLVAEELGRESWEGVSPVMARCLDYAALFGSAAAAVLWLSAEPLGFLWICDARTVRSLRIASLSLPCISLTAALSGYFIACGRVWKSALVHLLEQLSGMAFTAFLLRRADVFDLEESCAAVIRGMTAADLLALLAMLAVYLRDRRRYGPAGGSGPMPAGRLLRIALPLAFSAYARSALGTLQHLQVPRGLRASGFSADGALSGYGVIQGMVFPILFFPSCVLSAAAELIVPELTEAQVRGERRVIKDTAGELLKLSLLFSLAVSCFLFVFADQLGLAVYHSGEAGRYLRILAPLVPVMYTDMAVDGCLKGLGQQVWSMGVNILDALTGLLLIRWLLPRYALSAYIGILYCTELLNFILSALRLVTVLRSSPAKAERK